LHQSAKNRVSYFQQIKFYTMNPSKELIEALTQKISSPDEIDKATEQLAVQPRLINYHLAATIDLTDIGLGNCVYMPVQISSLSGGRKSLYLLNPGEKTMAGIFVDGKGIYSRFITRESGSSSLAKTGDVYTEEIRRTDGSVVVSGSGKLVIEDPKKGMGELTVTYTVKGKPVPKTRVWIFWSCILIDRTRRFD
jgi:hypothetical protein